MNSSASLYALTPTVYLASQFLGVGRHVLTVLLPHDSIDIWRGLRLKAIEQQNQTVIIEMMKHWAKLNPFNLDWRLEHTLYPWGDLIDQAMLSETQQM